MTDELFELNEIKDILGYIKDIYLDLNKIKSRLDKLEAQEDE